MILKHEIQIRWADIDANRHLRHSVYYDYGASVRMELLTQLGLSAETLAGWQMGPILFREEAVFRREIALIDKLVITTELIKATPDYSRWSFRHNFLKNETEQACFLTVDGAWLDLEKRKLAKPVESILQAFDKIPRSTDFEIIPLKEPKIQ